MSAALAPDEALIGYRRYLRSRLERTEPPLVTEEESLLAFVVRPDASIERIELGPIDCIEQAVLEWRNGVLAPIEDDPSPARGEAVEARHRRPASRTDSGVVLRELVFDPVRAKAGDARHWIVALDDVLHAVPFDALPEGDGWIGEHYRIDVRSCLAEIAWPLTAYEDEERALCIGGIDFDRAPPHANVSDHEQRQADALACAEAPSSSGVGGFAALLRGRGWNAAGFSPLPGTALEAEGIAAQFSASFEDREPALLLEGERASREALVELAPRARFLHIATHGWFAPESIPSTLDLEPLDAQMKWGVAMSRREQVRGSSPMILCGLALAGANSEARDLYGRVAGVITAEEIALLDLSHCELAVLSACDTSVGVRHTGQGVASLQRALQMAGARSVITSLWKVPDEATKDLMLDFYRRLWVEKKPKHQALWEAKMKLAHARDEHGRVLYSTRDWAAWVLTGQSD